MSKRPSIASLAPRKANAAPAAEVRDTAEQTHPEQPAAQVPPIGKAPPPYKAILSKVDDATHKQLRRLAIDEGVPVGDLQIEALNLLFRARRLPEIAVRVTPDERGRRG